jgi:hypothetical protein
MDPCEEGYDRMNLSHCENPPELKRSGSGGLTRESLVVIAHARISSSHRRHNLKWELERRQNRRSNHPHRMCEKSVANFACGQEVNGVTQFMNT